jgi:hypothetical protein
MYKKVADFVNKIINFGFLYTAGNFLTSCWVTNLSEKTVPLTYLLVSDCEVQRMSLCRIWNGKGQRGKKKVWHETTAYVTVMYWTSCATWSRNFNAAVLQGISSYSEDPKQIIETNCVAYWSRLYVCVCVDVYVCACVHVWSSECVYVRIHEYTI